MTERKRKRYYREVAVDLAILAVGFAVLFRRFIFFGAWLPLGGDTLVEAMPYNVFTATNLLHGVLPMWNPYNFCGHPYLALPHTACFYPPMLIFGLLPYALAAKIDMLAHLYLMGVFIYFLGRDLYDHRATAVLTAAVAMFSSESIYLLNLNHPAILHTTVLIPLVLLFLRKTLKTASWRWMLLFSATLALQIFSGNAQILVYSMTVLGLYTACVLGYDITLGSRNVLLTFRKAALAAGGLLFGCALAAIQLAPSFELTRWESVRNTGVTLSYTAILALDPRYLWWSLQWMPHLPLYACGLSLTPVIVLFTLYGLTNRRRPEAWAFALLIGVLGIIGVGPSTPLYTIIHHIPVLNSLRGHGRVVHVVGVLLPLAAGFGFDTLFQLRSAPSRRVPALITLAVIAALTCVPPLLTFSRNIGYVVVFVAFVVAMLLFLWTKPLRAWLPVVVAGAALVDVIHFTLPILVTAPLSSYMPHTGYIQFSQRKTGLDRVAIFCKNIPLYNSLLLQENLLTRDRGLFGYDAAPLRSFEEFFRKMSGVQVVTRDAAGRMRDEVWGRAWGKRDWVGPQAWRMFDLLNVRYIVSQELPIPPIEASIASGSRRFSKLAGGRLIVYENHRAYPPAFVVHDVRLASSQKKALNLLVAPDVDLRKTAILTQPPPQPLGSAPPDSEPVTVDLYGVNHVDLTVTMAAAGLLILTDVYYPGWNAVIDGKPGKVWSVDGVLRGVFLGPGTHHVRFQYRPKPLIIGGIVSAGSALLLIGLGATVWTKRRRTLRGQLEESPATEGND